MQDTLDDLALRNVLAWFPQHERKAAKAWSKLRAAHGQWHALWHNSYSYHMDMVARMQHNLDKHYAGSACVDQC